jgi:NADH-quinone oxidoreductase subunit L
MNILSWITFAPLVGAIVNGAIGKRLPKTASGILGCLGPAVSFALGVKLLFDVKSGGSITETAATWMAAGAFSIDIAWRADALAAVMVLVVAGVGSLIHVYSIEYMKKDEGFARFFTYLNLFMFSMLTLVLGANLPMMFLGWEGVGLCSYLLIGFWWQEGKNADAGMKAFITNRVGDVGFLLGIFFLATQTGTLDFAGMKEAIAANPALLPALWIPGLLLFVGACGKSAQIPLHVWLPDAMAGPTPVSALIHAATMVTAGVYMMARMHFVYGAMPFEWLQAVVFIGSATALMAGLVAVTQHDIKKVLAYSTVSQLGFMFAGMASTRFETGMFHVVTHAFFKALLFLGAGAVIHALHGEQDIRKMGGLRKELPVLAAVFIIGSLALGGCWPFAGYWSKDAILASVFEQSIFPSYGIAWVMLVATALLTAFYSTRLFCIVFLAPKAEAPDAVAAAHGHDDAGAAHEGMHKPGLLMMVPLVLLAALSLGAGALEKPLAHFLEKSWAVGERDPRHMDWLVRYHPAEAVKALEGRTDGASKELRERAEKAEKRHEHAHHLNQKLSLAIFLVGFVAAWFFYSLRPALAAGRKELEESAGRGGRGVMASWGLKLADFDLPGRMSGGLAHRFVSNKFYFDEVYRWTVVAGLKMSAAVLWFVVDRLLIDTLVVNGAGWLAYKAGSGVSKLHRGVIAAGLALTAIGAAMILRFDLVLKAWHHFFP